MTTTYRVDIDGETVWTAKIDGIPFIKHFGEYLQRPRETPDDQPNGSPIYLYQDDVLVGIQRAHADESGELRIAASWLYAGSLEERRPVDERAQLEADAWLMAAAADDASRNAQKALLAQAQAEV